LRSSLRLVRFFMALFDFFEVLISAFPLFQGLI
jgi:hypothetical protein